MVDAVCARPERVRGDAGASAVTRWQDIPGWFDWAPFYRAQVARIPDGGTIVECGCFLGRSAAFLADTIAASGKAIAVHAVDQWCLDYSQAGRLMIAEMARRELRYGCLETACRANLSDRAVVVHWDDAIAAADRFALGSVDLVFLDDDHSAAHVFAECGTWWPMLKRSGVLAGHDFDWPTVEQGVREWARMEGVTIQKVAPRSWMAIKE